MEKVGILTMHAVRNYGSYLQTLATYKFIENSGYNPIVIDYRYPTKYHLRNSRNFINNKEVGKHVKRTILSRITNKVARWIVNPDKEKKHKYFISFYNDNLRLTESYYSMEELFSNPPHCDIYVVGSDQVWNPNFIHHDKSFFLSWVPKGKKKISYASSIAVKEFPMEFLNNFRNELSSFQAISVRENPKFLCQLLQRDVKQVLDPTFLLNKKEWLQYFNTSPLIKGEYILCYILGYSYNPYPYIYKVINSVKKKLRCKVVVIDGNPSQIYKGYKIFSNGGPVEFLNLFYNAKFIITTSFHGTAFAINFNKNFIAVVNDISSNDNRIISIAEKMGIVDDCIIKKNTPIDRIKIPRLDKKILQERLEGLRLDSKKYFYDALKM